MRFVIWAVGYNDARNRLNSAVSMRVTDALNFWDPKVLEKVGGLGAGFS